MADVGHCPICQALLVEAGTWLTCGEHYRIERGAWDQVWAVYARQKNPIALLDRLTRANAAAGTDIQVDEVNRQVRRP